MQGGFYSLRGQWILVALGIFFSSCVSARGVAQTAVSVFDNVGIQFGGDVNWNTQSGVTRLDNGRLVERTITLPELGDYSRVTAQLNIWAQDDHWDRAGNIQLVTAGGTVELHKFITGFGGTTSHQQDVTNLIPFLREGPVTIRAFVDTWVPQAWAIDFGLTVEESSEEPAPTWNRRVFNDQDWRAAEFTNNRRANNVNIPAGLEKVYLNYLVSGHASDGSGGDEFTQRHHRIFIDGVEVFHEVPWRTDGINFRSVNPWSGRWGDVWSSDLHRAGWIPGDDVDPYVIDATQYLTPGRHLVEYQIEGIQPDGSDGYGYWRASSYVTGFAPVIEALPGDYNANGSVDAADYVVWRNSLGQTGTELAADGTGPSGTPDGVVDQLDYSLWKTNFGATAGGSGSFAGSTGVPEPGAVCLGFIALATCFAYSPRLSRACAAVR
jgi:hypothetical protein